MVSSHLSVLSGINLLKPFQNNKTLSVEIADVFSLDDLDFSDVFGPADNADELAHEEPEVIYSRSHSFVGPTNCASPATMLNKLHERDLLELLREVDKEEGQDKFSESFFQKLVLEDSVQEVCLEKAVSLEDFEILKMVGQGAFGKVYQVRKNSSSEIFAMKVMRKDKIMEKNHADYMKAERDILTQIDHPFIVQLRYSFQTKYRLYLVFDFVNGGHLFFQLYHQGLFREDLGRIYAAEVISAVSHLHAQGIMHRDLKPENILLDSEGHAMLTDFGFAKQFDEKNRSNSLCGTLEYMAPEIILGKGHDKAADWWSVGILLFEMLTGKPPFSGGNRHKIQQKILKDKVKWPSFLTTDAQSLIKGLLQKEWSKRLGSGPKGGDEIKEHKWFKSINWKKLEAREIKPKFIPQVAGQHCIANFDERWTKTALLDSPASSPKCGDNPFKGFSYVKPPAPLLHINKLS